MRRNIALTVLMTVIGIPLILAFWIIIQALIEQQWFGIFWTIGWATGGILLFWAIMTLQTDIYNRAHKGDETK